MTAAAVVYQWELGAIGLQETHLYLVFQDALNS